LTGHRREQQCKVFEPHKQTLPLELFAIAGEVIE